MGIPRCRAMAAMAWSLSFFPWQQYSCCHLRSTFHYTQASRLFQSCWNVNTAKPRLHSCVRCPEAAWVLPCKYGVTAFTFLCMLPEAAWEFRCSNCRTVSYTHLRAHETRHDLVCRLLLEKKKKKNK